MKKKFYKIVHNGEKRYYSLNALFAEELQRTFDTIVKAEDCNKPFSEVYENNDLDTQPFYKHISRSLKNNYD